MEMTDDKKPKRKGILGRIKGTVVPLAGLVLVIAITLGIFCFYREYPSRIEELSAYGYLGAFVISIIFNATLILPAGNMVILIALGTTMPSPVLVGLIGGLGAAIGEIVGYIAGRSGRELVARSSMYGHVEDWLQRWGWLTVTGFSIVPFVFDLVGLAAGALRYPFWKFFIFCWLGRTILYVTMVTLAAMGLKSFVPWLG